MIQHGRSAKTSTWAYLLFSNDTRKTEEVLVLILVATEQEMHKEEDRQQEVKGQKERLAVVATVFEPCCLR